jgi:hypothetical protein
MLTKIVLLKNQLVEMKLIVFIALTLLRFFYSIPTNAYVNDELCRGARLCSKEFFLRLFFLLTMCIHVYMYSHYFFYQANNALEE